MRNTILSLFLCFVAFVASAGNDVTAAQGLASRVLPRDHQRVSFSHIDSPVDTFAFEVKDGHLHVAGKNATSMAVALNHYLQRYCLKTVSWYGHGDMPLPAELPATNGVVGGRARVDTRFFLNYCTYGYTMPFWGWEQWQHFIDWMALSGVNMPLAITGQEAVWRNVWTSLGMTDEETRAYFTGPAYLPWHRMANIDHWNGPLPNEWLEGQIALQRQILARERELGMRPVLPAFAGHVPARLKDIYPDADIQSLGRWAGFEEEYACHFLNPGEPLFARIQKLFLEEQTRLFGTDHIYGVDPFNEVNPPSWEPAYLKQVSSDMFKTLTDVDPDAQWLQMAWLFYHKRKDWTPERIEALLTGVPAGRMPLLDYHCENVELWRKTDKFYGQPYIWCYLGNFGGNTTLTGNVAQSGARLEATLSEGGDNLMGIGSTLEGLDVVQFPYEYIFDKAWQYTDNADSADDAHWVQALADRHAGAPNQTVRQAMDILFNEIYTQVPRTLAILPNLRPVLDSDVRSRTAITYDPERLEQVWRMLASVDTVATDAMAIDLVSVGRQVLGNRFLAHKVELDSAYHRGDAESLRLHADAMLALLDDIDTLCAAHPHTSLGTWIADARSLAATDTVADYYEHNARNLITTWGGRLNDYASRTLSGLVGSYYKPRWQLYIDTLASALSAGTPIDPDSLAASLSALESAWVDSLAPIPVPSAPQLLPLCRRLSRRP